MPRNCLAWHGTCYYLRMKLCKMPTEEHPRARLRERGAPALRDAELLAVLLPTGPKGADALETAEALLGSFRTLRAVAAAPVEELAKVPGVGEVKATQIHAAIEIGIRLARRAASPNKMDDASRVAELVSPEMRLLPAESARVVLLNAKLHLIAVEEVSKGLLDQALVHAREVFAPAIARRAYAVVLVHNLCDASHKLCYVMGRFMWSKGGGGGGVPRGRPVGALHINRGLIWPHSRFASLHACRPVSGASGAWQGSPCAMALRPVTPPSKARADSDNRPGHKNARPLSLGTS